MNDKTQSRLPANALQAREWIGGLSAQLTDRGLSFRYPPEEPTSCCGRGCNGCVWEGYLAAVGYWVEQVTRLLETDSSVRSSHLPAGPTGENAADVQRLPDAELRLRLEALRAERDE